jgi:hypothetical protein
MTGGYEERWTTFSSSSTQRLKSVPDDRLYRRE